MHILLKVQTQIPSYVDDVVQLVCRFFVVAFSFLIGLKKFHWHKLEFDYCAVRFMERIGIEELKGRRGGTCENNNTLHNSDYCSVAKLKICVRTMK